MNRTEQLIVPDRRVCYGWMEILRVVQRMSVVRMLDWVRKSSPGVVIAVDI